MTESTSVVPIPWGNLAERFRVALGVSGPDADLASRALVESQVLGMGSFGIGLLQRWRTETAAAHQEPEQTRTGQVQHWDVEGLFGPLVLAQATRAVVEQTETHGIGVVVLHGLGGAGRLAPFVEAIAQDGHVGAAFAASPPLVAAHGGHAPLWGTNPFALAIPGRETPLVADASTASVTAATLTTARTSGRPLPAGTAVDSDGQQVTDPAEVAALLPRGGLMGTLAAMLVEALTSGLAGRSSESRWRAATIMAFATDTPIAEELRERITVAGAIEPGSSSRQLLERARRDGVVLSPAEVSLLDSWTHP